MQYTIRVFFAGIFVVAVFLVGYSKSVSFVEEQNLDETLQISTSTGVVQGQLNRTFSGRSFWSFRGIPYGRPPVGSLRFRAPKPAQPWQGVLDAAKPGPACVEILMRPRGVLTTGTEDCLTLNVYTPVAPGYSKDRLPVLVWFYGGAFIEGNSSVIAFGPEFLLDEDVVVVTLNYRLGLFGFLSTEDAASPGNYGLKDQLLALRWVKNNIKDFGGDPNRVTISGQSAGGSSVFYHVASPKSKGLFHRAIACSGSSLSSYARKRDAREIAFKVGTGLGINTKSSKELVSKLKMVNVEGLRPVFETIATMGLLTVVQEGYPFGPVIEHNHSGAFISESTYSLLGRGQFNRVPIIIGTTSDEALFFQDFIRSMKLLTIVFDLSPGSLPNRSMNIATAEDRRKAGKEIIKHYFRKGSVLESSVEEMEELMTDEAFARPLRKTAQLAFKYTPVYFYVFSYLSDYGVRGFDDEIKIRQGRGVVHGEDLTYIWKRVERSFPRNKKDAIMVSRMVKIWANFARTGNPTPEKDVLMDNIIWPSVNSSEVIKYLDIDSTFSIKSNFRGEHMRFWDSIYERYGGKSYITY